MDDVVPGSGPDSDGLAPERGPESLREDVPGPTGRPVPPLGRAVAVYSAIRIGLLVALTLLLELAGRPFGMPLIVAVAFAVVLQLPIAVLLFSRQRHDLTAALARSKARRTAMRDRLHTELTGREPLD